MTKRRRSWRVRLVTWAHCSPWSRSPSPCPPPAPSPERPIPTALCERFPSAEQAICRFRPSVQDANAGEKANEREDPTLSKPIAVKPARTILSGCELSGIWNMAASLTTSSHGIMKRVTRGLSANTFRYTLLMSNGYKYGRERQTRPCESSAKKKYSQLLLVMCS